LWGKKPYHDCNDSRVIERVQDGEMPAVPPGGVDDRSWELLMRCWSRDPKKRPRTHKLYDSLSGLSQHPSAVSNRGASALPVWLKVQALGLKFPPDFSKDGPFYVRFKYERSSHKTSSTGLVESSGECIWFEFPSFSLLHRRLPPHRRYTESWQVKTNPQYYGQSVSLDVLRVRRLQDKVCASGSFSVSQ
jgi:hypothetical protein